MRPWHPLALFQKPTLTTLFFRYYLVALLSLVLLITGVGIVIDKLYNSVDEANGRNFMRGTVLLVLEDLARHPPARWDDEIHRLGSHFSFPVRLLALPTLTQLSPEQRHQVMNGDYALDIDNLLIYARVASSQRVLVLGPLSLDPNSDSMLTDENHAQILWWTLTGLGFGILVFLALRPLWNDLVAIRQTAARLADGDFDARAPQARSWLLQPLSHGLNSMADRVWQQMKGHQAIGHAVAHELRTPIARLRFGLTMLDEAETEEDRQHYRRGMEEDMLELDELVNASLGYARLNRGDVVPELEDTDVAPWLEELAERVRPLMPPGMTLRLCCSCRNVAFDRRLMYIAVRNLLLNAVKYAQTRIDVTAQCQAAGFEIFVDDDGRGVPVEEYDRIFEPFHRLDNSRDRNTGGYGLGLSFVRLIAAHHGGEAWVETSPLGGARFGFRFAPRAAKP
ncbi:ATP-binding protein [Paludibacterium yongneupense]|uniref:ATP-binding protein n=1 Tax=Paludibacterium yongneupense TaxID=400061 RepID=UPI0004223635|nr:ATP-binding protein [Paludibacterium yongneupense]